MFSMRDRRRGWKRWRVWGWLGPAVAFMALLPIGAFISYLDQWEDRLLADGPVVAGVVVSEPLPIIDRGQPLTVAFDTSRGQRVEMTIEKYLVPRRKEAQAIQIQYAYDGDEVFAREAGWEPDFWSRWFYLCLGVAGAVAGSGILIANRHRTTIRLGDCLYYEQLSTRPSSKQVID